MARARTDVLRRQLNFSSDTVTASVQGEGPIESVRRNFRENIHNANREAKKILESEVRNHLRTGVKGEGYDKEYAKEKRKETTRSYGITGPVDFRYSGRLWNELVGRGRAKPSEPSLQVWLGLRHPNRVRPSSAPGGGGITYRRLTDYLRNQKPGETGDPFSPDQQRRQEIARQVADHLMGLG